MAARASFSVNNLTLNAEIIHYDVGKQIFLIIKQIFSYTFVFKTGHTACINSVCDKVVTLTKHYGLQKALKNI